MANAGTAYLRVMPVFQGGAAEIAKQLGGAQAGTIAGKEAGNGFLGGIGEGLKSAATLAVGTVGAIGGAIAGLTIKGGFSRALALDEAQAKFKALGYDVPTVMKTISASVDGTRFSLDGAATAAVGFMAAGLEGKELERVLRLVQDAAALANVDMAEMSPVFQKVASTGRVMGDALLQLEQNGVPATSALVKHLGKTAEEVRKMASKGQIDFATFEEAMEKAFGGMATNADSFSAFVSLIKANMSKIGALFATPLVSAGRSIMEDFVPALKEVKTHFEPLGEMFNAKLIAITPAISNAVIKITEAIGKLADKLAKPGPLLKTLTSLIGPLGGALAGFAAGPLGGIIAKIPGLSGFGAALGGINPVAGLLIGTLVSLAATSGGLDGLGSSMAAMASNFGRAVAEIGARAPAVIDAIVKGVTGAIQGLVNAIPALMQVLPGVLMQIVGAIQQILPAVLNGATDIAMTLLRGITAAIPLIIPPLVAVLPKLIDAIAATLTGSIQLIIKAGTTLLGGLVNAVTQVIPILTAAIPQIITAIVGALTNSVHLIAHAGVTLLGGIVNAVGQVVPQLTAAIPDIITAIVDALTNSINFIVGASVILLQGITRAIPQIIPPIVAAIPQIIGAISTALSTGLPQIANAGFALLHQLVTHSIPEVIPLISASLPDIITAIVDFLVNSVSLIVDAAILLFQGIVTAIPLIVPTLLDAGGSIVNALIAGFISAIPGLTDDTKSALTDSFTATVGEVFDGVKELGQQLKNALGDILPAVFDLFKTLANDVFPSIIAVLPDLVSSFKALAIVFIDSLRDVLPNLLQTFGDIARDVLPKIVNVLPSVVSKFVELVDVALKLATPLLQNEKLVKALIIAFAGSKIIGLFSKDLGETARTAASTQHEIAALHTVMTAGTHVVKNFSAGFFSAAGRWTFNKVVGDTTSAVSGLSGGLGGAARAASGLFTTLLANPIGLVVAAIAAVVAGLVLFFTKTETGRKAWAAFTDFLSKTWENIKEAVRELVDWFKNIWQNLPGIVSEKIGTIKGKISDTLRNIKSSWHTEWNSIKSKASDIWTNIKTDVSDKANAIKSTITDKLANTKSTWQSNWDQIKSYTSGVWELIKSNTSASLSTALGTVKTWTSNVFSAISGSAGNLLSAAHNMFASIITAISSKASDAFGRVSSMISNIASRIRNGATEMWNAAVNMVQGFINGIASGASAVIQTATNVATNAITAVKNALGIHSPSKVFTELGEFTGEGFARGLSNSTALGVDAAQELGYDILGAMSQGLTYEQVREKAKTAGRGFADGIDTMDADGRMSDVVDSALEVITQTVSAYQGLFKWQGARVGTFFANGVVDFTGPSSSLPMSDAVDIALDVISAKVASSKDKFKAQGTIIAQAMSDGVNSGLKNIGDSVGQITKTTTGSVTKTMTSAITDLHREAQRVMATEIDGGSWGKPLEQRTQEELDALLNAYRNFQTYYGRGGTSAQKSQSQPVIQITNHNPIALPTLESINKGLQMGAVMGLI